MSSRKSIAETQALARTPRGLASLIDLTLLRPETTPTQIEKLCQEAREYSFGAVMINPYYVDLTAAKLQGTEVKVGTVVGFPLGATLTSVKAFETQEALKLGAQEIDMVINIGALKSGLREFVLADIRALAEVSRPHNAILKVILETCLLTDDEKRLACELSESAGADFVKTSTGFLGGGATVADVALMHRTVSIGVKASGGIRTLADARAMIDAGATRLGVSGGVAILRELQNESAARA
jgi:deoxyribose-phosphate aldolase